MRLEQRLRHRAVQLLVRRTLGRVKRRLRLHQQHARVEPAHELGVETALGDGEQSVEEDPTTLAQIDRRLLPVHLVDLRLAQHALSVHGAAHEAEAVDLENVAHLRVDDEAADDELVGELEPLDGEALVQQRLLRVFVHALLEELHLVVDQRIVHVVADRLDRAHVESTSAVDAALGQVVGTRSHETKLAHQLADLLLVREHVLKQPGIILPRAASHRLVLGGAQVQDRGGRRRRIHGGGERLHAPAQRRAAAVTRQRAAAPH